MKKANNKKSTVLMFVLGIILMTISLPAFAATYYQTGFEASETHDYTLGPINAQPSEAYYQWIAPYYDSEVTNSFIYEGSQSCYIGGDNTNARINWGGTTSYNKYIHVMYRPESTVDGYRQFFTAAQFGMGFEIRRVAGQTEIYAMPACPVNDIPTTVPNTHLATLQNGHWYLLVLYPHAGPGANTVLDLWVQDADTREIIGFCQDYDTGSTDNTIYWLRLGNWSSASPWNYRAGYGYYDNVLVSSELHLKSADIKGHWHLNGSTEDSSGNNNHGTVNDPEWVDGKIGGALKFDGDDDYVNCANSTNLELDTFTIEYWFKPGNWTGGCWSGVHVSKYGSGLARPYKTYGARSGECLYFEMRGDDGLYHALTSNKIDWDNDTFYHIAVKYDNSNGFWAIYVNGELDNSKTEIISPSTTSGSFRIGAGLFNGVIDDVIIYDEALNENEIKYHSLARGGFITCDNIEMYSNSTITSGNIFYPQEETKIRLMLKNESDAAITVRWFYEVRDYDDEVLISNTEGGSTSIPAHGTAWTSTIVAAPTLFQQGHDNIGYFIVPITIREQNTDIILSEVCASFCIVPEPHEPSTADEMFRFGLFGGCTIFDYTQNIIPAMTRIGTKTVTCNVYWETSNPSYGQYDWTQLNSRVNYLSSFDVALAINRTPAWANTAPEGIEARSTYLSKAPYCGRYLSDYEYHKIFVTALADYCKNYTPFEGRVKFISPTWDEPNAMIQYLWQNLNGWDYDGAFDYYIELMAAAYDGVKGANGTVIVCQGEVDSSDTHNKFPFSKRLLSGISGNNFDCLNIHPYPSPRILGPGQNEIQTPDSLDIVRTLMEAKELVHSYNIDKKVWPNAIGYAVEPDSEGKEMLNNEYYKKVADYLVQLYAMTHSVSDVVGLSWFAPIFAKLENGGDYGMWHYRTTQPYPVTVAYANSAYFLTGTDVGAELSHTPGNSLVNSGFEGNTSISPWGKCSWGNFQTENVSLSQTVSYTGSNSVYLSSGQAGVMQTIYNVTGGEWYKVTGFAKTENIDNGSAIIMVEEWDETGHIKSYQLGGYGSGLTGTQDWYELRSFINLLPETDYVKIICFTTSPTNTGQAWFDDVSFEEIKAREFVFSKGADTRYLAVVWSNNGHQYEVAADSIVYDVMGREIDSYVENGKYYIDLTASPKFVRNFKLIP